MLISRRFYVYNVKFGLLIIILNSLLFAFDMAGLEKKKMRLVFNFQKYLLGCCQVAKSYAKQSTRITGFPTSG